MRVFCSVLWLIRSVPKRKKMQLRARREDTTFQISRYINIKIYRIEIDITLHYTTLINVIYIIYLYIYVLYPLYVLFVSSIFPFPGPLLSGRCFPPGAADALRFQCHRALLGGVADRVLGISDRHRLWRK